LLTSVQFPNNARRDNLGGFWKELFGYSHGLVELNAFYENVRRLHLENRVQAEGEKDENVVLEFQPEPAQDMLIACLWSHWKSPGEADLLSFAAITDDPPPEIAAAGHDRCIIPIKPENIDAWLNPDPEYLAMKVSPDCRGLTRRSRMSLPGRSLPGGDRRYPTHCSRPNPPKASIRLPSIGRTHNERPRGQGVVHAA
jgi:putative SOS response-associated peptidase YedK